MLKQTILHETHVAQDGKMVDFGGWSMPLHYGSQLDEHHIVRRDAGMFDVSHMTIVDITGEAGQPRAFLRTLLANDIDKAAAPGQAVYTCMLNEAGGVIDDLIAYWLGGDRFRLIVNAATRDKDLAWLARVAGDFSVTLTERSELAMIAIQGPSARDKACGLLPAALKDAAAGIKPFFAVADGDWFVARTGYTGEDGFEIVLPEAEARDFWLAAVEVGVAPCGLGARDTLRLEAGLNLYGSDMDESTNPYVSNLGWTVSLGDDREFIGAGALRDRQVPAPQILTGLLLMARGVLRDHQTVVDGAGQVLGEITSGGFSPTLQRSIALARIAADAPAELFVEVRGRQLPVQALKPPFVRRGKVLVDVS
ncbi:MAG: glycine cleavage system aminomethyltransferase GcvT [Pseudomonadota bacterium]